MIGNFTPSEAEWKMYTDSEEKLRILHEPIKSKQRMLPIYVYLYLLISIHIILNSKIDSVYRAY